MPRHTHISIHGTYFHSNGAPTFARRQRRGCCIEAIRPNLRVLQGIFDDWMKDETYDAGYQSVPVNWGISPAKSLARKQTKSKFGMRGRKHLNFTYGDLELRSAHR